MIHKCCSKAPSLISDFRRIHVIEDWQNYAVSIPLTFHDHYKFIEAPSRRSIVFGEHDYRYFLLLYCLLELEIYILSSPNFIIISKCVNPCLNQGRVEVIGKVLAGVFTSKTQEHLIFTIRKPWRVGFLILPSSHFESSKDKTFLRSEQKKQSCRIDVDSSRSTQHTNKLKHSYIYYPTFSLKQFSS